MGTRVLNNENSVLNEPAAHAVAVSGAIPLALMMNAGSAGTASAHVKWFDAYNVGGQPLGLEKVLNPDFEMLVGISIVWLLFGSVVEWTFVGDAILRAMN